MFIFFIKIRPHLPRAGTHVHSVSMQGLFVMLLHFSSQWFTTSRSTVQASATSPQTSVQIQVPMMKTGLKERQEEGRLTQ
jgi:hypothetical protein